MEKKTLYGPIKAINYPLKPLAGLFIIALAFFLTIPARAGATPIWEDDFDSYSTGLLYNLEKYSTSTTAIVVDTYSYSEDNSIYLSGASPVKIVITKSQTPNSGLLSFWFYVPAGGLPDYSNANLSFSYGYGVEYKGSFMALTKILGESIYQYCVPGTWSGGTYPFDDPEDQCMTITAGVWNRVNVVFDQYNFRVKLNNSWFDPVEMREDDLVVDTIYSWGNQPYVVYIDSVAEDNALTEGGDPIITPDEPEDCRINVVDFDNVAFAGSIEIPENNTYIYNSLKVYLQTYYTQATTSPLVSNYLEIELPGLSGGELYNYSATTTISRDSPYWLINYWIGGSDEWGETHYSGHITIPYDCPTAISETDILPANVLTEMGYIATSSPEDCSGYDLLERLICNVRNILESAFYPSQEKVAELNYNLGLIKQRFPSNYLAVSRDFFSAVNSGIATSSAISIGIFGNTNSISLEALNGTTSFAGSTQSVSGLIKSFFGLIFLGGFINWGVNFGKRVFK